MTLPQRMYLNPEVALERNQEFEQSMECKSCINHSYLWGMRVCKIHEGKAGNSMSICNDYREKPLISPAAALGKAKEMLFK